MRFNVNINQVRADEWGLNLQQAFLFAFLYELPSWALSKKNDAGELYYFASHSKISEELPILGMKKDTIYRNVKALINAGLVSRWVVGGKQDYYAITDKGALWNSTQVLLPDMGGDEGTPDLNPTSPESEDTSAVAADSGKVEQAADSAPETAPQALSGDDSTNDTPGDSSTENGPATCSENRGSSSDSATPDLNPTSENNPDYPGNKSEVPRKIIRPINNIINNNITYPPPIVPQGGTADDEEDDFPRLPFDNDFIEAVLNAFNAIANAKGNGNWCPQRTLTTNNTLAMRALYYNHDMTNPELWLEYFDSLASSQFAKSMKAVSLKFVLKEDTLINTENRMYERVSLSSE